MHGDVPGIPTVRGRQPEVVRGGDAHLDRERDAPAAARRSARAPRRSASGTASRGSAYSISRKRTVRRVVNTAVRGVGESRGCRSACVASRLMPGVAGRRRVPSARRRPRAAPFATSVSSTQPRAPRRAVPRRVASAAACCVFVSAGRCAGTSRTRSGRPLRQRSSKSSSTASSGSGRSTACSRNAGHALDGHVDEHAERAESEPRRRAAARRSRSRRRAAARRRRSPASTPRPGWRGRRSAAPVPCVPVEIAPAMVCAVDVAQVLHRQAERREQGREAGAEWCRRRA